MNNNAYIALGSNVPFDGMAPRQVLANAVSALQSAGLTPRALSGIWETAAWPPSDQADYYNAVAVIDPAGHSPQALFAALCDIEMRFGRVREEKWAPRTLDLDIIAMDGFVGTFGRITLPHPRTHERAFVLAPLAEAAPEWKHHEHGRTAAEMLGRLPPGYRYQRVGDLAPAGR
jgi:2-amino-4-hydroxy-6-hydroxymethyldihydropteridine diphosphokinase